MHLKSNKKKLEINCCDKCNYHGISDNRDCNQELTHAHGSSNSTVKDFILFFVYENSRNLSFTHVIDMAFLLAMQLAIIKKYFIETYVS